MRAVSILMTLAVTFLAAGGSTRAAEPKSSKSKAAGPDLFAQPTVVTLKITIPSASLEALRKDPKEYVKADVNVGETSLTNVGVRLKGSTTYQSIDKRPALTLKFNEFVKGQELKGRTKVLLNTSLQDPSCIAAVVASEIFRAATVPAPKCAFARVQLNGRDVGLYSMTEAANKDFLSDYFKKTKGNLYEGDNNDILDKLEKDSGDDSTDQADLKALASAVRESDPALRWKKLAPVLDVDRFLSLAAIEAMVWHHDGYTMEHNNYRIYSDPGTGQMVFLVHGLDELFEKIDGSLTPECKGIVAKAVFGTPEGKKRYADMVVRLTGEVFQSEPLLKRVDELAAMVRPSLDSNAVKPFDAAVTTLRDRIGKRVSYVQQASKALAAQK